MNLVKETGKKIKSENIYKIVFYGPSTTDVAYSFPNWTEIMRYVLREYFNGIIDNYKISDWHIQTSNRGLKGASSKDLLVNLESFVIEEKPDLVFLSVTKNDAYYDFDIKKPRIISKKS